MEPRVQEAFDELHAFMYEHVYHNPCAKGEEKKVPELVEQLFDFFMNNPQRLPDQMQLIAYQEGLVRAVCDHVAGMTDHFAVQTFTSIYIPNPGQARQDQRGKRENGIGPLLLRRNHSSAVRLVGRAGEARGRAFL